MTDRARFIASASGIIVDRAMVTPEEETARMAAQIVKLSLAQDRMVQDLAVQRGESTRSVRNSYGIGEK